MSLRIKRSVGAVYINILIRKNINQNLAMLPYLLLKKVWSNRQKDKEVSQMKYLIYYKRSVPQLVSWKTNESLRLLTIRMEKV